MVYSVVLAAWGTDGRGFKPQTSTNACGHVCRYVDQKGLAVMLTSKQSAGVAPEGIHPTFETQGRRHQKSKTGVSVAPQKGLVSYKKFLKKTKKTCFSEKSE